MLRSQRRALVSCCGAIALAAGPALSQEDPAYPAATCAALWMAHARTLGPVADPTGPRDAAVARSGQAAAVDAFIATRTQQLIDLILASADNADEASRALFEEILATCQAFDAEIEAGLAGARG